MTVSVFSVTNTGRLAVGSALLLWRLLLFLGFPGAVWSLTRATLGPLSIPAPALRFAQCGGHGSPAVRELSFCTDWGSRQKRYQV